MVAHAHRQKSQRNVSSPGARVGTAGAAARNESARKCWRWPAAPFLCQFLGAAPTHCAECLHRRGAKSKENVTISGSFSQWARAGRVDAEREQIFSINRNSRGRWPKVITGLSCPGSRCKRPGHADTDNWGVSGLNECTTPQEYPHQESGHVSGHPC